MKSECNNMHGERMKMLILYFVQICFSAKTGNSDGHLHKNQSQTYNKSLCSCTCVLTIHTSGFKLDE